MPSAGRVTWGGSLHQSYRILPTPSQNLAVFLEGDGLTGGDVLARLPYDAARSRSGSTGKPDPRRYRDGRQVYQTAGFLYEDADGIVRVTDLGRATSRWLPIISDKNFSILGRHAAYALSACQLRNPTGTGGDYDESMVVFPFAFIWRAMLALENKLSSDELNRAIFKVRDDSGLEAAIASIRNARARNDLDVMGPETIPDEPKNDRIIPWVSIASFGWTLFKDKRGSGTDFYEIPPAARRILQEAAQVRHKHRDFESVQEYIEHVSHAAALPDDLR